MPSTRPSADHVAAISSLYFRSVARRLLVQTRGNLYALNLVSRLGELSGNDQVRVLDNTVLMSHLRGLRLGPDGNWIDPLGLGRNQHAAAAPLSGAFWDCLVELYQDRLVARGAIGPRLDTRGWTREEVDEALGPLQDAVGAALERFEDDFFAALQAARDLTGLLLARCVQRLDPDDLDFATVAARFCEALVELGQGHLLPAFVENFLYREIDPRPLLGGVVPVSGRRRWVAPSRSTSMGSLPSAALFSIRTAKQWRWRVVEAGGHAHFLHPRPAAGWQPR